MIFFNAFLVPLIWLIHPWNMVHTVKRHYKQGRKDLTQRQANKLMQDVKFSMGKHYAQIIQCLWFIFLYSSLLSIGPAVMALGFICAYWVSKYNLLRRCSINENVNGQLSLRAVKMMDATLMMRGIGDLIFDMQIRQGASWQPILCICLGVVYLFLPMDSILQWLHDQKFKSQQKQYQQIKHKFIQNYRTMHPLYANERINIINGVNLTVNTFNSLNMF